MSEHKNIPKAAQEEEINLREELAKFVRYWPWFIGSVLLSLVVSFSVLRYKVPVYESTTTIVFQDEGGSMSEMKILEGMGLVTQLGGNNVQKELGILKSNHLMSEVVRELGLNISYFVEGNVQTTELYNEKPLVIEVINLNNTKSTVNFAVDNGVNGTELLVTTEFEDKIKRVNYNEPFQLGFATVVIKKNLVEVKNKAHLFPIHISIKSVENIASSYLERLQINKEPSGLIALTLTDPIRERAQDILNQLIVEYNKQAIEKRNLVASNTANFVKNRLEIITRELDSVETEIKEFKETEKLINVQSEGSVVMGDIGALNAKRRELETQQELTDAMMDYVDSNESDDLLPANLGMTGGVNSVITQYNQLVLERNQVLAASTLKNPAVQKLNRDINEVRANLKRSLEHARSTIQLNQQELERHAAALDLKITTVPGKELEFLGIERQQNIKEALYLFLLQKREETSLSLAVTEPKAQVVDVAYSSSMPVAPNKPRSYAIAAIIGFLIPFTTIFLKNFLNNKIRSRADVESNTGEIPVVGEIPKLGKGESEVISENDRSVLAESFRILHTNLQYLLVNAGGKTEGITILLTSTVKGEGKTFTAFNLAVTLANTNKKVIIVGGDLRNPQLQRFDPDLNKNSGVSDYLVSQDAALTTFIKKSSLHPNLDLLASGSIPPNPSELLRQDKTRIMFQQLENLYDYVIIDTAPAILVADTFLIQQYADLILYVVRAGYTERKLLNFAVDAKRDGKLKEVSFVLNNVEAANFGYGNKYGYAYGEQREGLWSRMKNKAAFW